MIVVWVFLKRSLLIRTWSAAVHAIWSRSVFEIPKSMFCSSVAMTRGLFGWIRRV